MHARALDVLEGLGHECCVHVVQSGNLFNHETKSHHAVGHGQGVGVAQIDFVLAWRIFVEAVFHGNAHGF